MPRTLSALAAAVTVALGLAVRAFLGGWFAKYAGDALYTVLIYWLIVLIGPRLRPWLAALIATATSWAIEFAQLGEIPSWLRPLLGSTFNAPDLLWYAVGAALAWCLHTWYLRRRTARS
ncbi:ribosomal maturation YjgA family protein [Nonomuraea sediminis]|uniref:ribosomal maturation YjgA family protein n=1 Tax=Nonomuraea sediminis TaxID=2835864 RepID=UPI001BDD7E3F|nr:DUF2809 domain-containing protein [Nonomuraea sediminis]